MSAKEEFRKTWSPKYTLRRYPEMKRFPVNIFYMYTVYMFTYRFNHSEEDMFLDCSVVSSLVLVSHLLRLDTCDIAVGPASDAVTSHYKSILLACLQGCINGWDGNLSSYTVV